ncbi:MAG: hypothetical protein LBK72_00115, partial [Bifidobacteriaceae bacterium]|nr:hypothetical protein [Bifidobacteriaceae bacterium]
MAIRASRMLAAGMMGAALAGMVAGCVDDDGSGAGPSVSPEEKVAVGDLYGVSESPTQTPSAPSASAAQPEPALVTGPPPEPTSGPDA